MRLKSFYYLENTIQNYAWGSKTQFAKILGIPNEDRLPQAEIWMGAHEKAPSKVVDGNRKVDLNKFIAEQPKAILGKRVEEAYSGEIPFLFKVLSAETPLSVQVHPDAALAVAGYLRENDLHIPLKAPNRNYKDPRHKPELVCAITDFQALKGFRPISEIIDFFGLINLPAIDKEFQLLQRNPSIEHLGRFYRTVMHLNRAAQTELIGAFASLQDQRSDAEWKAFMRLLEVFPGDIGVLSPFWLNLIVLQPGEALHLDAGELHGYLHGTCIEIMANSDNVIRGGLTKKHIDLKELFKVLRFQPGLPEVLRPHPKSASAIKMYPSGAKEFSLSIIDMPRKDQVVSISMSSIEILICLQGRMRLRDRVSDQSLDFRKGNSCVIPAVTQKYQIEGAGVIYRASVPV